MADNDLAEEVPAPPPVRRCLKCFYVLDHLPENVCPECGQRFVPEDPGTWTTKPPYVRWRYWLPATILVTVLALLVVGILVPLGGFGWAVTVAVPLMIGGLVGYSVRIGTGGCFLAAFLVFLAMVLGLAAGGAAGIFCGLILFSMAIVPLSVSVLAGAILRESLRQSKWSQREWLPLLCVVFWVSVPLIVAAVESQLAPLPVVTVQTTVVIDATRPATWNSIRFYEEVSHDPPWLLRLGLRTPVRTVGRMEIVGDRRKCIYTRGHLTKELTEIRPGERLAFRVVEQEMFEDYSVRLLTGSFDLTPTDDHRTRVTLTTRYQPLLRPRMAWQPFEERVVHDLHRHVLNGMAWEARKQDDRAQADIAGASR